MRDRSRFSIARCWLFGVTFLAVAAAFGVVMWWLMRKGGEKSVEAGTGR